MKIQIIGITRPKDELKNSNLVFNDYGSPESLDSFDINIITLQENSIWENQGGEYNTIERIGDFSSLQTMVYNSTSTKVIFLFPLNYSFAAYNKNANRVYAKLKDKIRDLIIIIGKLIPSFTYDLFYEKTTTTINNYQYQADFYFDINGAILKSDLSKKNVCRQITKLNKPTNWFITTLNSLNSYDSLMCFLNEMNLIDKKESIPAWIKEYFFDDDASLNAQVEEYSFEIQELDDNIKKCNNKLSENLKYKTILYTNGDELVKIVFEILEKILEIDLSKFQDEHREDFQIKLSGVTFIGEIKGISSNVKSANISQIDVHYQSYLDDLCEKKVTENVKQLLIINPLRSIPVKDREKIHEEQIKIARRNGCLIITTEKLLKLFELFLNNKKTVNDIIKILSEEIGELQI